MISLFVVAFVLWIIGNLVAVWVSVHPFRTPLFLSPGSLEVPQEDVIIPTRDGLNLRAWWTPVEGSREVVLLVHGYMMNRSEPAAMAVWFWKRRASTLLVDLRAHGTSPGKRSGFGWAERQDVIACLEWIRQTQPEARIVVWGSSMGAAAATYALAEDRTNVVGLMLDSAYGRLIAAVSGWWRFIGGKHLATLLCLTPYLSRPFLDFNPFALSVTETMPRLGELPVLILHGQADNLATPDQAQANADAAQRATLVWFPGCRHSEARWIMPQPYYDAVASWWDRAIMNP